MSNIENRVVSLEFDNGSFQQALEETLEGLDRLQAALDFSGAEGAFQSISEEAGAFDLQGMADAIDNIEQKFSAMGAIAFTVLQDITRSAIDAGQAMVRATVGQVLQGGKQRALAIEQAKFQFRGLGQDVEKSMQSALDAVTGTSFGLDEAATVAAQFGAAGLTAGNEMTGALRGVAGIASLTGSSFADIGQIFTTVAGQGRLMGTQLFQFATRGINMAAALAKEWGVTEQQVRDMATEGEISFEKFAKGVDSAFGEHAQKANETYAGSLANVRAAMSRLGATFYEPFLPAARDIFNSLQKAVDNVGTALGPVLALWKFFVADVREFAIAKLWSIDFASIGNVISTVTVPIFNSFKNLFYAANRVLTQVKGAFEGAFGKIKIGDTIIKIVDAFERLTEAAVPSSQTLVTIQTVMQGVFSAASIVWEVIKGVAGVFKDLWDAAAPVRRGLADIAEAFSIFLIKAERFLVDGGRISDFFDDIGDSLKKLFSGGFERLGDFFSSIADSLTDLFSGIGDGLNVFGSVQDRISGVGETAEEAGGFLSRFGDIWDSLKEVASNAIDYIRDAFEGLGGAIGSSLEKGNFNEIVDVLNLGILGGLAVGIKKFGDAFEEGVVVNITNFDDAVEAFSDTLGAMQNKLRSDAILNIAKAVGILTISIVALSFIDSVALTKSLVAISAGFGILIGAFTLMNKVVLNPKTAGQMLILAFTIGALAAAMVILSIPIVVLSRLDWNEIAKGLVGVAGGMAILIAGSHGLIFASTGLAKAGFGLIVISVALNVLALAIKQMAGLSWEELAKGLVGVGVALAGMVAALYFINPAQILAVGGGLLLMSVGLLAVAGAMRMIADLSWEEIAKGLVGLGLALTGLVVAGTFGTVAIAGAAGIAIMAASMLLLAKAMEWMGKLEWGEIVRALVAMAGGLLILGLLGTAMGLVAPAMLLGAIALAAMSAAILVFAAAVVAMSKIEWGTLTHGLLIMAAAFGGIALISVLLLAAVPAMLAFGAALVVVGLGIALFGAGAFLFAKAFEAMANAGEAGVDVVIEVLKKLLTLMPTLATSLAEAVIAFLDTIFEAAPEIIEGLITIAEDLLDGIIELAPKVGEALTVLIQEFLTVIQEASPQVIETVIQLIMDLIQAIIEHLPEFCRAAGELIRSFGNCLLEFGSALLGQTGMQVLGFLLAPLAAVGRLIAAGARLIGGLVSGLASGIGNVISTAARAVAGFIGNIAGAVGRAVSAGASFMGGLISGVANKVGQFVTGAVQAAARWVSSMTSGLRNAISTVAGIAGDIARAIKDGILNGIGSLAGALTDKLKSMAGGALDAVKGAFGIGSPSKEFHYIGEMMVSGWTKGVSDNERSLKDQVDQVGETVLNSFADISRRTADALAEMDEFSPTIAPVLDLTQVQDQAANIGDILGRQAVVADATFAQAEIQRLNVANAGVDSEPTYAGPQTVIFNQENNSPESLSTGKIYRQTKSQIELAKKELGVS